MALSNKWLCKNTKQRWKNAKKKEKKKKRKKGRNCHVHNTIPKNDFLFFN